MPEPLTRQARAALGPTIRTEERCGSTLQSFDQMLYTTDFQDPEAARACILACASRLVELRCNRLQETGYRTLATHVDCDLDTGHVWGWVAYTRTN